MELPKHKFNIGDTALIMRNNRPTTVRITAMTFWLSQRSDTQIKFEYRIEGEPEYLNEAQLFATAEELKAALFKNFD